MVDVEKIDTTDFFQGLEPSEDQPELKLLVAVLQRAILDYTDPKACDYHKWNASRWLFSHSRKVMSVWWICCMLSDDPDRLRHRLIEAIKEMRGKPKMVVFRVES